MSSSLDDMPAYEHFQDALDAMASGYPVNAFEKAVIHKWIEYVTFSLCISTPEGITNDIWKKYLVDQPDQQPILYAFVKYVNEKSEYHLKFNHLLL